MLMRKLLSHFVPSQHDYYMTKVLYRWFYKHVVINMLASVKYAQKFAQSAFGNFPKILPIMLFMLLIMLVLCSNMNNIDVKM